MGVFRSSSCLITSRWPGIGLLGNSEGSVAEQGVLREGKDGLGDLGDVVLMVGVGGRGFSMVDGIAATVNTDGKG